MTGNLVNLSPICSGGTETIPKLSRARTVGGTWNAAHDLTQYVR